MEFPSLIVFVSATAAPHLIAYNYADLLLQSLLI